MIEVEYSADYKRVGRAIQFTSAVGTGKVKVGQRERERVGVGEKESAKLRWI